METAPNLKKKGIPSKPLYWMF